MGNLAGNRSDFALWLVLLPGRAPAFFSDGLYISEALDSADSVRFSKSECFERLKNTNDVLRPFFGGVKRNDPDRISVLPTQQVLDNGFEVRRFGIGFPPDAPVPAEIVDHQVDVLIFVIWNDRWRSMGPTHYSNSTQQNRDSSTALVIRSAAGTLCGQPN
ncbi:hypothetical protein [Bradyrhizobium sp.]|uniref:hypothetical protein n=1 Tax=Bradyrhizobium sp. TaxID=376 RepID=UPI0025C669A4|nr:hypothetical protein [Bradyrhizobium sp.]